MAALAPADAARLYGQALELLERDTTHDGTAARVEVLRELARACFAYNHAEGIETLRRAGALAIESGDPELLARVRPDPGAQSEHLPTWRPPPARSAAAGPRDAQPG